MVEDGTGIADANSYVDVDFVDSYFSDRGNTAWAGEQAAKEGWLIQATDYIEMVYSERFIGTRTTDTQALSWPRTNAASYADNVIPLVLKKACAEYALRAKNGPLAPDPTVDESGVIKVAIKEKVGPLETDSAVLTKGAGSTIMMLRPYPAADMLLRSLLITANRVIR